MSNEFDLGLNIASIETELPDPVITFTGSDSLTALETAEMPLLALTVYGRSWQSTASTADTPVEIESIGDSGTLTITACGKNLLFIPSKNKTENGIAFIVNEKGSINADGTPVDPTLWSNYMIYSGTLGNPSTFIKLPAGSYKLIGTGDSGIGNLFPILYRRFDDGSYQVVASNRNAYETEFVSEGLDDMLYLVLACAPGHAPNNETIKISIVNVGVSSDYEPYKSTTAEIATGLPLRGIPVASGGNYTDSDGQEWVCDTLEHIYGEPAQVTKRVEKAHFKSVMETHGCDAAIVVKNTADHFVYFGRYGHYFKNNVIKYYLYECLWEERYDVDTGELIHSIERNGGNQAAEFAYEIYGKWTVESTDEPVSFAKPLWELDNGKPVPTEYLCETTGFVNGAEVIYPCEPETLLLTTAETEALNALSGFTGSTTVYNDNTAEMTVKLLREDFEMQYIHWIKESQSFVCEKAGKYKIICVGGGSSGGIGASGAADVLQAVGTTTSFGTIISAEGGGKSRTILTIASGGKDMLVGGQGGYDGINYGSTSHVMACESGAHFSSSGGNSSVMWGAGHGYGAGGGARGYSNDLVAAGGRCGKVESTIVDLEENQTVACTIGGGGVLKLSDENVLNYLKNYVDKDTTSASGMGEKISACVSSGADGVIVIQYLGV